MPSSNNILALVAICLAVFAVAQAFPGPQSAGPQVPARVQPRQAENGDKTDLKAENSYGFGYAYGGNGGLWGYGSPYGYGGYGYGYPYGYSYGYPGLYGGYGGYGGYGYPFYG